VNACLGVSGGKVDVARLKDAVHRSGSDGQNMMIMRNFVEFNRTDPNCLEKSSLQSINGRLASDGRVLAQGEKTRRFFIDQIFTQNL